MSRAHLTVLDADGCVPAPTLYTASYKATVQQQEIGHLVHRYLLFLRSGGHIEYPSVMADEELNWKLLMESV